MTTKSETIRDSLQVSELITALPKELNEEQILKDSLGDLIARISTRKVPVGSLARMWTLGSMQAKIAMGYLAYAVRSNFLNDSEKQQLLNETNLAAALKLFGTMGYLRGAIMKVGQMLGNLPKVLPREFADVLGSLHFEAPAMHFSMIREVFLDELGKEPEEIFASFDRQAFAAASLGQVHRARLKTGEEVAVKIQYPNMNRMISSDMRNLRALVAPMRFQKEWDYIMDHLEDAEEMLKLEADYEKEAEFLQKALDIFKEHDEIVVPKYYKDYSTSRVLTMDYLPGKHLQDFIKDDPTQELRNHFGELISVALMRLTYHSNTFYADPHPGNFLMMDDGRLGFIDFGCHRELTEDEWQLNNNGEKVAMFTHDKQQLDEVIASGCLHDSIHEMDEKRVALLKKILEWIAEPGQKDEPFDFGDEDWFQRGVDINVECAKQRQSRYAPIWNWTNRTILGHRTLMYRLKCRFNFRKVYIENNTHVEGR
ncbi:MAG: AarF/ABC1/UbiB kinase family protein [Proteobacteria bacterium]|nr:AarF/ABC1/UbiB kinase family protein [Pseudomonadota bacterium]